MTMTTTIVCSRRPAPACSRRPAPIRARLAAALALAVLAGCGASPRTPASAADAPRDGDSGSVVERTLTVPAGKSVELNVVMPQGSSATARFHAGGPLAWNTHSHPDGKLVIHQEGADPEGELVIRPDAAGIYSFLWTNEGDAAVELSITAELHEGAIVHSWHP